VTWSDKRGGGIETSEFAEGVDGVERTGRKGRDKKGGHQW